MPILNLDNEERRKIGHSILQEMMDDMNYTEEEIQCMVDIIMNENDYTIDDLKKILEEGM